MPIIANAKKALRQTKTRTTRNRVVKAQVRNMVKNSEKKPDVTALPALFSTLDKAVKRHIIHKNKAARLKSQAAKRIANPDAAKPVVKKTAKKATKKTVKSASRRTAKSTSRRTAKK